MPNKAAFSIRNRNPDVLTCIANLSNDEVFTPPGFASQMLDLIAQQWAHSHGGEDIWTRRDLRYLDPFTKSGVFLREVVKRLTIGLTEEINDLPTRINHILQNQVFGIGITQLTSYLARRSVYCSKSANGPHSIGKDVFNDEGGNIWFKPLAHSWTEGTQSRLAHEISGKPTTQNVGGRCRYCGASQLSMERNSGLESHAYAFIHTENIRERIAELFGDEMQFDVIIGNPPYQFNDGGGSGTSARPIYDKFVEQAIALDPRLLTMVIPARWFSGGKGLDEFRETMLGDDRIRVINDYPDSTEVFPGVQIKGGICVFLWERDNPGKCKVTTHDKGEVTGTIIRPLLEPGSDIFIRYNQAIPILKKVIQVEIGTPSDSVELPLKKQFSRLVSTRRPFGNIEDHLKTSPKSGIKVYRVGGYSYANRSKVISGLNYLDSWKIFIPFLASGSDSFPHSILGRPFLGSPGTATTETNLVIGPFSNEKQARNAMNYISTRFFRFLVLQRKPSQNATRKVYGFVPLQDFRIKWTDEMLYQKYKITKDEIEFIERMVRPMELSDE